MKNYNFQKVSLKNIIIHSSFWQYYIELIRLKVLPYQWELLNDRVPGATPSGCIRNYRIAAGLESGRHTGMVFQDSDVAKWLEAVGNLLTTTDDPFLENAADSAIDIIASAQQPDGYLNTYYIIEHPDGRWKNLRDGHELYCAGHLIEAAVAYYHGTGKNTLLDVALRLADHICMEFGDGEDQIPGYPGHQEIELALIKLYELTENPIYSEQASYFIHKRGTQPNHFDEERKKEGYREIFPDIGTYGQEYSQNHAPVVEQHTAEGHAVRAVYQYAAMADLARITEDEYLYDACRKLIANITEKRMYVTGGIGSSSYGERFTCDYDLPNDTAYAETCASIGLIRFLSSLARIEPKGHYYDTLERALYNTVLSGLSLTGDRFFYVNPLEVEPLRCKCNHNFEHVKTDRQTWFGVACCPPNIARTIPALGEYAFTKSSEYFFIHMYVAGIIETSMAGNRITFRIESTYPLDGDLSVKIDCEQPSEFTIAIRIPTWCQLEEITTNGERMDDIEQIDGYIYIKARWSHHVIRLRNTMTPMFLYPNTKISGLSGKIALQYGPFIYCTEELDNGPNLAALELPHALEDYSKSQIPDIPEFFPAIVIPGKRKISDGSLYSTSAPRRVTSQIVFVPYCVWNNRSSGEMRIWLSQYV